MRVPVGRTVVLAVASAALAAAAGYETPRPFKASELLKPAQVKGPHHQVAAEVPTEGYLHVFSIKTDWGPLEAEGMSQALMRIHEVGAIAELAEVSKSEVFLKAAGTSVLKVGEGVASAVKDPGATAKGVGKGLKRFGTNLGRKAKRVGDQAVDSVAGDDEKKDDKSTGQKAAETGEGIANSALGVNGAARRWAKKVGVDPYTTNPVLKKALVDLGRIDAAGGIAAKVVVPIPMVVSSTAKVGNLVWDQDPEALLKKNEASLRAIGVTDATIKQLYLSKGFTLTTFTRLAGALEGLKVKGVADYVAAAAESDIEREALFFAESAEMLQRLHAKTPVVEVLEDSRALVAKTKAGGAVALVPLDTMSWTEAFAKAVDTVTERSKKELAATTLELQTTAALSPAAKKEMAARGWTVVDKLPSTVEMRLQAAAK